MHTQGDRHEAEFLRLFGSIDEPESREDIRVTMAHMLGEAPAGTGVITRVITGLDDVVDLFRESVEELEYRVNLAKEQSEVTVEERFAAAFRDLSEDQKDLIADLVEDIAAGEVKDLHVATRDSARLAFARFESATSDLSAEERQRVGAGPMPRLRYLLRHRRRARLESVHRQQDMDLEGITFRRGS